MKNKIRIGIDLGGTKVEIIALDENGIECYRRRLLTEYINNFQIDYQNIIIKITELVNTTTEKLKINIGEFSLGIGTPGALDFQGLMKNANSQCLNGRAFKIDLENQLGYPIKIANDANCFALSEAVDGAGKNAQVIFGVILGTGCGGGIVVDKKVLTGINSIGGEWGHNPLPYPEEKLAELPGRKCYCGRFGCLETWISGTGLADDYFFHTQKRRSAEEIANLVNTDEACNLALVRYEERLAKSLAGVINILDPDVIVLGGGVSRINRLYDNVPKLWGKYIFSPNIQTQLLPPVHGDSSGVRGAAWL